jgi:hypothetical protein
MEPSPVVKLREETLLVVKDKAALGCFLCRRVLAAIGPDNLLRDWPQDGEHKPEFSVEAQKYHLLGELKA